MKKYIIWLITVFFCTALFGQSKSPLNTIIKNKLQEVGGFPSYHLFETDYNKIEGMDRVFEDASLFQINASERSNLLSEAPLNLEFDLPTSRGNLTVQLTQHKLLTDDFTVVTNEGRTIDYTPGLYYRGIVDGDPSSFAAVSIFEDEIVAMVFPKGQEAYIIGKVNKTSNTHIGYYETDLIPAHDFSCDTDDNLIANSDLEDLHMLANSASSVQVDKCVRVYLELEYNLVTEKGGAGGAINFMTGLFNVVALLYQNESITTNVSQIFTWTTPDSYPTNTTLAALQSFRSTRPTFNGDLAHLVSRGAPTGGGIAYVNALCGSYKYAYSYIHSSYNNYPTYSWSVNVIAHEMGHNLGSRHTHDCVWNGNNTAIDGCGPTAGYASSVGSCPTAALPAQGQGSIMSYCHLLGNVGIGLPVGFGPQPGNLIRARINSASCLDVCETGCPTNLSLTGTIGNTQNYEASNNITSTQTLTASSDVDYKAGNLIIWNPGFIATNGTNTRAYIGACNSSLDGEAEETALYEESSDNVPLRTTDLPSNTDLRCMPNPFSTITTIEYRLTEDAEVDLHLFNLNGQLLHSMHQGAQPAGLHRVDYKANGLSPGVYYLKMQSGNTVKTTKMILAR